MAIEVDLTSITKAEDYEDIGVVELWIYRNQVLYIYTFNGQHYQEHEESRLFPTIPVKKLIPGYVEQSWKEGSRLPYETLKIICSRDFSN